MDECIFCKIVAGKIPSEVVFEDDQILVFKDIHPKAPVHWLIIPKIHLTSMQDLNSEQENLAGHLFTSIPTIAKQAGISESGYVNLISTGKDGGQEVPHLHVHLLGGQPVKVLV